MLENISLSSFCKAHGLSKGSVHKFLKGEGFDTSTGLTPDMVQSASAYFLDAPQSSPAEAVTPEIVVGNHRGELALPSQPSQIDLAQYRGDAALASFEGLDIERFLESCDGFLEAVEADYQHQQAITQRKAAAAQQVAAKVEQVKQASLVYQLRSESLSLHNATLDQALQQGMAVLGKPDTTEA